jgi:hypothetical protein
LFPTGQSCKAKKNYVTLKKEAATSAVKLYNSLMDFVKKDGCSRLQYKCVSSILSALFTYSYAFILAGSDDEDDAAGRYRSSQRTSQPISKVRVHFFTL